MLFVNIILPVFLIILAGFCLEKRSKLDFRTLTNIGLYLFAPALVFSALVKRDINLGLAADLFWFMIIYTAILMLLALAAGRLFRLDSDTRSALSLSTVMMNVGNFGLPLAYFAFGDAGLEASVLVFVLFTIPLGTLGIIIAQGAGASLREAVMNAARIPLFHSVALAFAVKALGLPLPAFVLRPIELLGQAAIPLMLVMLGMQLARTSLHASPGFLSLAVLIRLGLAPVIAWGVAVWLEIPDEARKVVILQTSTPSAVLPLLYSLRFGSRPDLVAGAIFVTTLLSALSLTLVLYLLQ